MSGSLLNTTVLTAHDAGGRLELPTTAAISAITLGELRAGVRIARDELTAKDRRGPGLPRCVRRSQRCPSIRRWGNAIGGLLAVARLHARAAKATAVRIIATPAETGREL